MSAQRPETDFAELLDDCDPFQSAPRADVSDLLDDLSDPDETEWAIPLMGKSVRGPFFETGDDGSPMVELCELVKTTRDGRVIYSAETLDVMSHDTRWTELRDDPDLSAGRYRLRVRSAKGQVLAAKDITLTRKGQRGRQHRERKPRPTDGAAPEVMQLRAELDRVRQQLDDVKARLTAEIDAEREAARRRQERIDAAHEDKVKRIEEHHADVLARAGREVKQAREDEREARKAAEKARAAQWEAEKRALLAQASTASGGALSGIEEIKRVMAMKGEIDELLGAGGKGAPPASMDDRVTGTLTNLSNTLSKLGQFGAMSSLT